ncbi:RDD family protein [Candidatus Venteria ishoeyi]|uniref:RDD family protein n=1 Tax=Candidatus Venteria ishoeyi TaxID=1899563 RepID=A0A1H6FEC9_9GAMM|nr:RDD family protein [Candidatus Venteria ishoeyi]SEH08003.1 RDD family protein [Candidatus Venteria ishoeyi]
MSTAIPDLPAAGLFRTLAAIFYDSLLLIAVLIFAGFIALPFSKGESSMLFNLYIYAICYLYFSWPWMRSGQTLGMRTWRIRLYAEDGSRPSWQAVLIRFLTAMLSWFCLGMGYWWMLIDTQQRSWHDITSKTLLLRTQ